MPAKKKTTPAKLSGSEELLDKAAEAIKARKSTRHCVDCLHARSNSNPDRVTCYGHGPSVILEYGEIKTVWPMPNRTDTCPKYEAG